MGPAGREALGLSVRGTDADVDEAEVQRRRAGGLAVWIGSGSVCVGARGQASRTGAHPADGFICRKWSGVVANSTGHEQLAGEHRPTVGCSSRPCHVRPMAAVLRMNLEESIPRGLHLHQLRFPPWRHRPPHFIHTGNTYSPLVSVLTHQCRLLSWHWVWRVEQHGGEDMQDKLSAENAKIATTRKLC